MYEPALGCRSQEIVMARQALHTGGKYDRVDALTADQAEEVLSGLPLVAAMAGSLPEMKALRERCLAAGIPALVGQPRGAGKG